MKRRTHQALGLVLALVLTGCGSSSNPPPGNNPPPPAANNMPVANAGADQATNVLVGDVVVLDGSGSSDADGDTLSYVWTLTAVPADSTATLSDPFSDRPTFAADKAGTYVTQLTVNDGKADSAADDVNVMVVVPVPTVTIATPVPGTVATENRVTVAGTVDDPLATITVDGNETPNNGGAYSADVTLAEGENTVTVVATNSTGEGSASVDVTLRTVRGRAPAMTITSHKSDFTAGFVWDGQGATPTNNIPVTVNGTITTNQVPPTVTVNGVAATVGPPVPNPLLDLIFCRFFPNRPACDARFTFSATILLSKGLATITAIGRDAVGGSTTLAVSGVADYCKKREAEPGVVAERGDGQKNRCHEIDGCNRNKFGVEGSTDTDSLRNRPMPNAQFNAVLVEFGSGYIPPSDARNDFFVHGQNPRDALGCNFHDTCYQTSVPLGDRDAAFAACNAAQLENHRAMCRKAYPGAECPFTITGPFGNTIKDPVACPLWAAEKAVCFDIADTYLFGVGTRFGRDRYDERQGHYSLY